MRAARATPEASIVQAARAVAEGRAQALVCAGGTGAALAAGSFNVKRARGIYRPALAIPLPVPRWPVTLLDVGASAEARREHLVQFAFMGAALSRIVLGVGARAWDCCRTARRPRAAARWWWRSTRSCSSARGRIGAFEFVGNVEGGDVVEGVADVIVTDGFTGNIALKLMEGVSQTMLGAVRDAAMSSPRAKSAARFCARRSRISRGDRPGAHGGAYLLGLRSLGVVPHGRFTRAASRRRSCARSSGAREDIVGQTHAGARRGGGAAHGARVRAGR